ncbi:hypothetical protein Hanom_Chr07g00583491 [Helianthus anomalus]
MKKFKNSGCHPHSIKLLEILYRQLYFCLITVCMYKFVCVRQDKSLNRRRQT